MVRRLPVLILIILFLGTVGWAQVQIETIGRFALPAMEGNPYRGSDIWGYTDGQGRNYAFYTSYIGLHVFDLTDPTSPVEIDSYIFIESRWKDVKTYVYPDGKAYAFMVADGIAGPGLVVLDLNKLPEKIEVVGSFPFFTAAHNIFISPENNSPYAYVSVSNNGPEGGVYTIDINDPTNPTLVHHWNTHGVHDVYASKNWASPSHQGRELVVFFGKSSGIVVMDYSDKANPVQLSSATYDGLAYSHSGWMDKTGRYLYICDELDEVTWGNSTTLYIMDLINPEAPVSLSPWTDTLNAIDHNCFTLGDHLFLSNYTAGVTLLDIANPATPVLVDREYPFDPFPDIPSAGGIWGVYPYFDNGLVIASDIDQGLLVMKMGEVLEPFLLYASQTGLCLGQSEPQEETITLKGTVSGPLAVSLDAVPEGMVATLDRTSIAAGESLKLGLTADPSMAPGTYNVSVLVGSLVADIEVRLYPPDGNLSLTEPFRGQDTVHKSYAMLRWNFTKGAAAYTVRVWPKESQDLVSTYTSDRDRLELNTLSNDTTYFWQVEARDNCSTYLSDVWDFSTFGSTVLLVSSSNHFDDDLAWIYTMNTLGLPYEYRHFTPGSNPFSDLDSFKMVVWFTGSSTDGEFLSSAHEDLLQDFANGGGQVVIAAQDYYTKRGNTVAGLPINLLGVDHVTPDSADFYTLEGGAGWEFLGSSGVVESANTSLYDDLSPQRGSQRVLFNPVTNHVACVATPRSLYLSLPLRHVEKNFPETAEALLGELYLRALATTSPNSTLVHKQYLSLEPEKVTSQARLILINPGDALARAEILTMADDGRSAGRGVPHLQPGALVSMRMEDVTGGVELNYNHLIISSSDKILVMLEGIEADKGYALPASRSLATTLSVPHIAADTDSFYTLANISNGTADPVDVSLSTPDGASWSLPLNNAHGGSFISFQELFNGQIGGQRTSARVTAGGAQALAGVELFGAKQVSQLAGLSLEEASSTTLVFSHLARVENGWWTGIAAVNPNDADAFVTLTAYDSSGAVVAASNPTIPANGKLLDYLIDGYRATLLVPDGIPETAVWLKLESDQVLTGYELFSDSQGRLLAGLGASGAASTDLVLPFVGDDERYCGIALLNDTDADQGVDIVLYDNQGCELTRIARNIPAGGRILETGHDLFGTFLGNKETYGRVAAPLGVHGFVIYGDFSSNWLAGINGMAVE